MAAALKNVTWGQQIQVSIFARPTYECNNSWKLILILHTCLKKVLSQISSIHLNEALAKKPKGQIYLKCSLSYSQQ